MARHLSCIGQKLLDKCMTMATVSAEEFLDTDLVGADNPQGNDLERMDVELNRLPSIT